MTYAESDEVLVLTAYTDVSEIRGVITDIQRFSVQDGIGIRTIVFLKGCPLRCPWCHNPETGSISRELAFYREKCIGCGACATACESGAIDTANLLNRDRCIICGKCAVVCCTKARVMVGEERTVSQVMRDVSRDHVFFDTSGGGLTLSGGEPMAQPRFACALMNAAKSSGINTAMETCGYCSWKDLEAAAKVCDMFLYDIKHMNTEIHRSLVGVGNENIHENLRRLGTIGSTIIIRIPLIPGVNDEEKNLKETAFLAKSVNALEIHLMPFHQMAQGKWNALDKEYTYCSQAVPEEAQLETAKKILEEFSELPVNVGGYGENAGGMRT